MKKMKKVLIAVLACIVVCGISVPVIAANMQKTGARMEQKVHTRNSGVCNVILGTSMVSSSSIENSEETELAGEDALQDVPEGAGEPTDSADVTDTGVTDTAASPVCPSYVDVNGDGICDHCAHGGSCNNYVDYNGDGVCDYCAHGGSCGNYVDANGDGSCDYCSHNGSGHCGSYVDSNGDGICDNYTGGGNSSSGGSGHHGRHHSGGHH